LLIPPSQKSLPAFRPAVLLSHTIQATLAPFLPGRLGGEEELEKALNASGMPLPAILLSMYFRLPAKGR